MSGLDQFLRLVVSDADLKAQLGAAKDKQSLVQLAVKLGSERGLLFSTTDAMNALKSALPPGIENYDLADAELEAVAGGKSTQSSWTCGLTQTCCKD